MTITEEAGVHKGGDRRRTGLTWRRLVIVSGTIATVAMTSAAVYLWDVEGGMVVVAFGLSTWLFRSGRVWLGAIGLFVASAVTVFFMTAAALINSRGYAGTEGMVIAGGLSGTSLLVLLAVVGWMIRRESRSSFGPWVVVALAALNLLPFGGRPPAEQSEAADLHLVANNVAFSETELSAPAGVLTVSLENRDLFWHTFTVEELGVDLRVPVSAEMTVTFDAQPGEYTFICAVPGHPEAGMKGTLVVKG